MSIPQAACEPGPGAINGGFTSRGTDTPSPVITIGVDSIDETLKKVEVLAPATVTRAGPAEAREAKAEAPADVKSSTPE